MTGGWFGGPRGLHLLACLFGACSKVSDFLGASENKHIEIRVSEVCVSRTAMLGRMPWTKYRPIEPRIGNSHYWDTRRYSTRTCINTDSFNKFSDLCVDMDKNLLCVVRPPSKLTRTQIQTYVFPSVAIYCLLYIHTETNPHTRAHTHTKTHTCGYTRTCTFVWMRCRK